VMIVFLFPGHSLVDHHDHKKSTKSSDIKKTTTTTLPNQLSTNTANNIGKD